MRSLNALIWRNLTAHALRSILTALAITLGVAMVLAASIVGQAAGRSASELADGGPRIDLEVFSRDDAPFDASILETLRASPDVERVSPSLRVEAELAGAGLPTAPLTLLGVAPESYTALHQPELANGAFLDGSDTILIKGKRSGSIVLPMAIAIDNGLNVGDEVTLAADGQKATLTVAGRLKLERDVTTLIEETVAYVPLSVAQNLARAPGKIGHVEIALHPTADGDRARVDLARRVGTGLAVVRAAIDGGAVALTDSLVQLGLAVVGVMMLFAAAFVIMNAFAMSITARTQEIGALRALGMTSGWKRSGVMRMVLTEALVMGVTGATFGVVIGIGLAWGAMHVMGTLDEGTFIVPGWGVALSVALGVIVTLLGALRPALRASRISPLVALRSQHQTGGQTWYVRHGGRIGALLLLCLFPSLIIIALLLRPTFFIALAVIGVGEAGLLAATVLLLPALIDPVVRLARPFLVRWLGTAGRLAADNLGRNKRRTVLTAGALMVTLTAIIATSGIVVFMFEGGLRGYMSLLNEDGLVAPDFGALIASGEWSLDNAYEKMSEMPLDPGVLDALTPLAEAGLVEIERIGFAPVPPELTALPGSPGTFVDPEIFLRIGNFDFFAGDPETALAWMERGRAVLLGPLPAERLSVSVGDTIPVQTPQGEVTFTVAGIGGTATNFPIFPYADGEAYFDLSGAMWLGLAVPPGQDVDVAIEQVQAALEPFEGVAAGRLDTEATADMFFDLLDRFQILLNALLLLVVVVASLGVVNTMVINVFERRREIALLRAVGATQRQVRQAIVAEAALLGLMAAIIATGVSVFMLGILALVMTPGGTASMGFRVSWELAANGLSISLRRILVAAALSMVAGPLAAALAAYYPARQAAALDVVEATRSERVTLKRTKARRSEGRRRMTRHASMARSLTWTLAWRSLAQHRLRTTLTALAVALGAATVVAADVISAALLNSLARSEDAQKFMTGLLEQLGVTLQMVGVGITLAAGFLIFNAFAMAVTQRRRQIGSLRALGMTRRQVLRLVLVESLVVGGLGTLFGLVAGPLLGKGTIALMKVILGEGLFVFSASNPSLSSLLLATALGMIIALLSALIPAWQAARVLPLVALREGETRFFGKNQVSDLSKTWLLGVLIIIVTAVYLAVAPPGEWVAYPWDQILAGTFVLLWLVGWGLIAPALIGGLGRWVRGPLTRLWGATGRLVADNLRRGRGRVTLTILTLVVGLTMIIGMTGFISFTGGEFMRPSLTGIEQLRLLIIAPFDVSAGMSAYSGLDTIELPPELIAEVPAVVGERARVADKWHFTIVPELSFFGSSYFSFVTDPRDVEQSGDVFFTFIEGDWETAMPIMKEGCGVLLTPLVASRNGVALGETFEVSGADGPVACTVAGIGRPYVNASIIGLAAKNEFAVTNPFMLQVIPRPGVDRAGLKADLVALVERYPDAHLLEPEGMYEAQIRVIDAMPDMLNALLLLAILAAALGVVNTTMMSVSERRRELGLLRAVGATRRQVSAVVTGEAALMGVIGGGLGLVVGVGVVVVIVVTYGGNSWGVPDLDLWGAAWRSVQPALLNGLVGLIAAPFICAGAAWLPVRGILRGSAIETMEPKRNQVFSKKPGFLSRGSIRTRFALGTAALMILLLAGLITVVTTHARTCIEEQTHDALRTMVNWNAGMIELGLPDDAETLDFDTLTTGQGFDFDADALLRFESLMDDMTANGLVDFTVADRDDVVLIGLDTRDIGALAPELEMTDEAHVYSERESGEWLMHASAPIRNADGLLVGSVRLTIDTEEMQDFLSKLRNRLGAVGVAIVLFGVAVSWGLATPLARATRRLADRATGVARGEYLPYSHTSTFLSRFSLRTKLTAALVLIIVVMVGVLELVAIPIERHHVEDTLRDGLAAGVGWIGQAASESFDVELSDLTVGMESRPTFEEMIEMTEVLDLARLQELTDQMRADKGHPRDDVAYTALVDEEGAIVLSDQLALIGEETVVSEATPNDVQIEETTWRGEEVWVASTPLRRGRDGEQIGALQMAMRLNRVETFLDESRNLFRLTGLIAVLAGVLLAQAIGGAVTAPVRRLAADTRRVGEGDLSVQFRVDSADRGRRDELALLASAYNQMVAGLQEREWLRDMFGRFVSREVAEAIRSGQVRLEGENRVVSVLFCDIRGFTARSERSTPEEVVALLNEYLPVVIEAAQAHAGTVNKFGGDSTLVIYGAPRRLQASERRTSAYQAVLTALEMRANLARLNERLVERGEEPIRIGVGINTGMALAGAVGPEERQEYTVIGDTVNLASRIEALNKQYPEHDVLISGQTYEALGRRRAEFALADLGEVRIRGKAEPVRVWAVVKRSQAS